MTTAVHLARNGRLVGQAGFFFDRQCVHVGTQPDDLVARPVAGLVAARGGWLAPANDADHASAPNTGDDFVAAEAFELIGNRAGSAMHVVTQFRMGVDIPPPFPDLVVQVGDAVDDWHRFSCSGCLLPANVAKPAQKSPPSGL
jgi:hypothetical protein